MNSKQALLKNMHTFNVAVKTMSFKAAANELHLTQSAVSHRIKVLEQELGFNLFVRGTRQLFLTPEGERLHNTLARSLSSIFNEIDNIQSSDLSGDLRILTAHGFAREWLVPRLGKFKQDFPNLNLLVNIHEEIAELDKEEFDIAFYYGDYHQPNVYYLPLFEEMYLPICSPQYAKEHRLLERGHQGLESVNFLHSSLSTAWPRWLESVGSNIDCYRQSYQFTQQGLAVEAAKQSAGVAIGRLRFMTKAIESGELLAPFSAMETKQSYALLCMESMRDRPKIAAFIHWVKAELAQ
ncbi:LysR substrate-binding domain-containing protein [Photobacterium sanguinicancri]|uniref:Transcriptional regulator n=1 Tax=Photobacterium sanguinicancri TaxID=875932 RepID=A0ABX4FYA2_9GAMM|nr:LysR substrate-binding domain-containing protein [Photobacterium sanguinicancri]OZS43873.1 transcriptional regulator [Photobacterium sanguinicancri]